MKPQFPISVIHIASGDLWAGAEAQLFTLAKTLHSFEKVTVRVILLNHGELEQRLHANNIPVEVLLETGLNGIQILLRLLGILRHYKPDIVHTHRLKENILGGLAASLVGNIPCLRTTHGAPEHRPGWRKPHKQILYWLDWTIGRFLQSRIIAVSDDMGTLLKQQFPSEKITVIENGVDIEALAPYERQIINKRNPTDPIKVGLVGRLVPIKRVDIFIETAKYLKEHYPNFKADFFIYGDGPLRPELEELSTSLDTQSIVHFEGHQTEIHPAMATLDVLLITSDHEGLPMTLLEAMALNIPICAHSVGGITHLLNNTKYGTKINKQEPKLYAQEILNYISNPEQTSEITENAKFYIIDNYGSDINGKKYLSLYRRILKII